MSTTESTTATGSATATRPTVPAQGTGPKASPDEASAPDRLEASTGPGTDAENDAENDADNEAEDTGRGYVSFEMHGEMYALAMESVQEIIRRPALVKVPLGPPALEGLSNLRGKVLPVVSLRRCCALPDTEDSEATRVVVVEAHGATLGLVVDRVAAVVQVEPEQIEPADAVQSTVRSDLLAAIIKGADGQMTTVLDVEHLVAAQFELLLRTGPPPVTASGLTSQDRSEQESADTLELVSFAVDGQEYAVPIDRVQEIVQAPEAITSVPNADRRVLGVMDLRGGLLPVLSLRSVLGLPAQQLAPHNRIVVITFDDEGTSSLVGVVMDTVREVLRVPQLLVDPLPHVVSAGGRRPEVESVCRLEKGERLVSVLSVDHLVDAEVRAAAGVAAGARTEDDQEEDDVSQARNDRGEDELFVVFRLEGEEYCVDVDAVQEIIRVPETLVHVPRTLDFIEGMVNLRGVVLPVVDLRTRLGLERLPRDERQRIVVLILGGVRTGFVVDSVAEVAKVAKLDLEAAPELSNEQSRVISRVANIHAHKRMLLVLNPEALLETETETAVSVAEEPDPAGAAA